MSLSGLYKTKMRMVACVMYGMWGCLGAYRGHQHYKKRKEKYHLTTTKYSYIDAFLGSLVCGITYTLPGPNICCAYEEIKLLEKKMRNIEDEDF